MSDTQDQFNLVPPMDEPTNSFKVVHLCNQSKTYHLTRQVLFDCSLTQDTCCFFYHILTMTIEEFNNMYESFACLIERSSIEADIYLNVDDEALSHIVKYIQTNKIDGKSIYLNSWKTVDEIIDLATMFGMPKLVSDLRSIQPSEEELNKQICALEYILDSMIYMVGSCIGSTDKFEMQIDIVKQFIKENKNLIIDSYVKPMINNEDTLRSKTFMLLFNLAMPFITSFISKYLQPTVPEQKPSQDNNTVRMQSVPIKNVEVKFCNVPSYTSHIPEMRNSMPNEGTFCQCPIYGNEKPAWMKNFIPQNSYSQSIPQYYCSTDYYCPKPLYPQPSINTPKFNIGCNLRNNMNSTATNNYCNNPFTCNESYDPNIYYCRLPTEPPKENNATEEFLKCLKEEINPQKSMLKCVTLGEMEELLNKYTQTNKCSFLCPSELMKIFKSTIEKSDPKDKDIIVASETDDDTEFSSETDDETESISETDDETGSSSESNDGTMSETDEETNHNEYFATLENNIADALKKLIKSEVDVKTISVDLNNNTSLEALGAELKDVIANSLKNLMEKSEAANKI